MADRCESGIPSVGATVPSAAASRPSEPTAQVLRDCHDILGAAAVIIVNLEYVSQGAQGEARAALEDARTSVEKIVELANAIRRAHEGKAPAPQRSAGRRSRG